MANTLNLGTDGNWATKENSLLGYNSENGNYKPLPFDFTRASNGTFVNKSGLIETAANGVPRIDFLGNTKGALLLEPQRSNIFDYSSNLSAWSKLNSTVTESNVLSLDGVNNSYGYERTSDSTSYIYRTVSLSNTTDYTLSFFVKSGTSTNVRTDIWDTLQSVQCQIQVDLATKTVSNFDGTSYKIEDYTNGWMRISVTFTSESSFGTTFNRYFNVDSVGSELYIWGVQLEAGSYGTSLINTQGSAVTRVKDNMIQEKSSLTSITQGTFFLDFDRGLTNASARDGNTDGFFYRSENSFPSTNAIEIGTDADGKVRIAIRVNGFQQLYSNDTISRYKMLIKWSGTSINVFVNGVLEYTSTARWTATLPLEYIGYNSSFRKSVNKLSIFSTALTDAEAIALTTI